MAVLWGKVAGRLDASIGGYLWGYPVALWRSSCGGYLCGLWGPWSGGHIGQPVAATLWGGYPVALSGYAIAEIEKPPAG